MPKNKKSWIDKKKADTYLVIHRNQQYPLENKDVGNQQSGSTDKNVEEHINCGIYFDDDYNYLKHLRDLNEIPVLEKAEKVAVSKVIASAPKPLLDEEPSGRAAPDDNYDEPDPEIDAALEGDFDFDDPENELDDDFIICANDGVLPTTCSKNINMSHRPRIECFNEDSEAESSESEESEELESDGDDVRDLSDDGDEPMDELSCVKERNPDQRLIDQQFERLCDGYDDDKIGLADDEEEPETLIDPDSLRMKELVEERKKNKDELVLNNDYLARKFAEEDSDEQLEDITVECSGPKKARWDCETVLSTYSNIYNHPCVIKEPSRKQRLKAFVKKADEDYAMEEVHSHVASSLPRPKAETAEERRMRKSVVKEQRKERRVEKKCNKLAFKEERRKLQLQQTGVSVKMTPIA